MSSFSLTCFCVVTLYSRIYTCQMLGKCYSDFSKLLLHYLYLPDVVEVLQWLLKAIVTLFIPARCWGRAKVTFLSYCYSIYTCQHAEEVLHGPLKATVTLYVYTCQMQGKCSSDFSKLLLLYSYLPDAGEVLQWLLKVDVGGGDVGAAI